MLQSKQRLISLEKVHVILIYVTSQRCSSYNTCQVKSPDQMRELICNASFSSSNNSCWNKRSVLPEGQGSNKLRQFYCLWVVLVVFLLFVFLFGLVLAPFCLQIPIYFILWEGFLVGCGFLMFLFMFAKTHSIEQNYLFHALNFYFYSIVWLTAAAIIIQN